MSDDESTSNPIDTIYSEMEEDRIHLDRLQLDKRFNKNDYDFISRLPLTAKQLINVLYELYPLQKNNEPTVDLTSTFNSDLSPFNSDNQNEKKVDNKVNEKKDDISNKVKE
jgi:hypothetical protein